METDAAFFILRSDAARFQIRSHGFLVEVVDSDRDVVYLTCRLAWPEDQKISLSLVFWFFFFFFLTFWLLAYLS